MREPVTTTSSSAWFGAASCACAFGANASEPTEPSAAAIETESRDGAIAVLALKSAGRGRMPARYFGVMYTPQVGMRFALGVDPLTNRRLPVAEITHRSKS